MVDVSIQNVTKKYGARKAIDDVSLNISSGEFVTLLGPSGCGKTTLLRIICGLIEPGAGSVIVGNQDITNLPANRRNMGMVFQSLALFPHKTVFQNVEFGLRMRGVPKDERLGRVNEVLQLVHLSDFSDRWPRQLSGGQQQRVALARALVVQPSILLLDEPFAALDRKLRELMQLELRALSQKIGITSIFVTHDQEEALVLSDKIVVLNAGKIEQIGKPVELYTKPDNRFVADFLGVPNIFEVEAAAGGGWVSKGGIKFRAAPLASHANLKKMFVMLRPESLVLAPWVQSSGGEVTVGTIESVTYRGASFDYRVRLSASDALMIARTPSDGGPATAPAYERGQKVMLTWPDEAVRFLNC